MDKNFINKHKFGMIALLFFILLVSQEKILYFLTNSALGRLLLVLLLLSITNFNIILGIIAVLFVIIMLNKDEMSYLEAFEPETKSDEEKDYLKKLKDTIKANKAQQDTIVNTSISAATEPFRVLGREGYNTMERERVLQQGKNSNQLFIGNTNKDTENISPFDEITSTPLQI